jgi:predicted kinase
MKTIYALSGYPGSGKSTLRATDPRLKDLPFVDVADIYAEFDPIGSQDAFSQLLIQASEALKDSDAVVLEATFPRGHWQRTLLEGWAKMKKAKLEYIELAVDPRECYARVLKQYDEVAGKAESDDERARLHRYFHGRIDILNRAINLGL